jgi:hypothetical protein
VWSLRSGSPSSQRRSPICRDFCELSRRCVRAECCPNAARRVLARASTCNRNAYLQAFPETGATGLEPATSGVTDRSWRLRSERRLAGIPDLSRAFRLCRCGDLRVPPGASGGLLRDQRGMRRCLARQRGSVSRGALAYRAALSGSAGRRRWRWLARSGRQAVAALFRLVLALARRDRVVKACARLV